MISQKGSISVLILVMVTETLTFYAVISVASECVLSPTSMYSESVLCDHLHSKIKPEIVLNSCNKYHKSKKTRFDGYIFNRACNPIRQLIIIS